MYGTNSHIPKHDVIRAPGFDAAADWLDVDARVWDWLVLPIEERIARDPCTFPRGEGTPQRVAPLLLPDGRWANVYYSVGVSDRPGVAACVLVRVVLANTIAAP